MGLQDFFKKAMVCPECRSRGATKTLTRQIKCPHPSCKNYDSSLLSQPLGPTGVVSRPHAQHQGSFDPGSHRIAIQYRNFRGEDVEFEADERTVRFVRDHVSVRVAPSGKRVALAKKFVKNLNDLESAKETFAPEMSAVDRQILGYHKKHGTTSARYEELRRKYPDWDAE